MGYCKCTDLNFFRFLSQWHIVNCPFSISCQGEFNYESCTESTGRIYFPSYAYNLMMTSYCLAIMNYGCFLVSSCSVRDRDINIAFESINLVYCYAIEKTCPHDHEISADAIPNAKQQQQRMLSCYYSNSQCSFAILPLPHHVLSGIWNNGQECWR